MEYRDLIYDWNGAGPSFDWRAARFDLNDETLRDGLQCPSVKDPTMDQKVRLLHLMADLGIVAADIGLPGAGPRAREQVVTLAREIVNAKLKIAPNCAARTHLSDVTPIVEISQQVGIAIEAATFIGSSPIRLYTEDWTLEKMLKASELAVTFAVRHGLPVMFVTEDTTRADAETLQKLYDVAIGSGAKRICASDTVGHATPEGVRNLLTFLRRDVIRGREVKLDYHGHNDRGLGTVNALAATAVADRVHGSALGIGERVGNTSMDQLLINMQLWGLIQRDLAPLVEYVTLVSEHCGVPIPANYPALGADAFRTGTGVHAAAVIKAIRKGDRALADRVYSGVPASALGREQRIEVGPMSGESNVVFWLESHGHEATKERIARILERAKASDRLLTAEELTNLAR